MRGEEGFMFWFGSFDRRAGRLFACWVREGWVWLASRIYAVRVSTRFASVAAFTTALCGMGERSLGEKTGVHAVGVGFQIDLLVSSSYWMWRRSGGGVQRRGGVLVIV